jgi:hypothetical protein
VERTGRHRIASLRFARSGPPFTTTLGMHEREPSLVSNPARALTARIAVGCLGGLLVYFALPTPLDMGNWWEQTAHLPFVGGAIALLLAIFAPSRWCEMLIP